VKIQLTEIAGLTTRIAGPDGPTPLTAILLHGFGAPGDDLVGLAPYLKTRARFVFPAAPIELDAMYGEGRAWWPLDLMKLDAQLRSAKRDFSEVPEGLAEARAKISALVDEVGRDGKVVLGGFSQGAMLALDVALHRDAKLAGIVLLSGTLIADSEWTPLLPRLAGVPIFMSHGRHDPLLPFSIAESLRDRLTAAGAAVEWHAFGGGHEIPADVLDAADSFLSVCQDRG
jgi:phospholipase/carboxylesterase